MKTLIAIIIIAGGVYYGAQRGWVHGQWLAMIFGGSADDRVIAETVNETNKDTPRMVGPEVRFEKALTDRKDVVFVYRFVNQDLAVLHRDMSIEKMRDAIIRHACGSSFARKEIFDRGYSIRVQVNSRDYHQVLNATVRADTCS